MNEKKTSEPQNLGDIFYQVCFEVAKKMKARNQWSESQALTITGFYIPDDQGAATNGERK